MLGVGEAEHVERTADLTAVLGQRRKLAALRVVAEKRVEHLLHMAKIGANLAADLRQEHAFLRSLRHFVQHRRACADGTARACGIEAREHCVHLTAEVGCEIGIVLERALGQQQRRRVFHRQRFRHACRR